MSDSNWKWASFINNIKGESMKKRKSFVRIIPSIIGVIISLILIPLLVMNLTIIVKSYINPDEVPGFFGIKPFIVSTGSMEGTINIGDLVITKEVDPATLEVGDIISYKEESSVITHRIIAMTEKDGELAFTTKGDANNTEDDNPVTYSQVEGIYLFRIARLGNLAMFMQTPVGMIVFIGIPICCFILYDIIRRRIQTKKEMKKEDELQAELDRLRSQIDEQKEDKKEIEEND